MICSSLAASDAVVAVGTPTIARYLDAVAGDVVLVDRQPFQDVRRHIVAEIGEVNLKVRNSVAVLDPPWYPDEAAFWIAWAAAVVGTGGRILVSLWPESTRPTAQAERRNLTEWINAWGNVSTMKVRLDYQPPTFEKAASATAHLDRPAEFVRRGELVSINVEREPALPPRIPSSSGWLRFTVNDYQLAVRDKVNPTENPAMSPVPGAENWVWPHVSRRAEGRDAIDVWSSQNEVAVTGDSLTLTHSLRAYLANEMTPEVLFRKYPALEQWKLPAPPFWRVAEWRHR